MLTLGFVTRTIIIMFSTNITQAIPEEMEFDPNSTPPCYKTADSVSYLLLKIRAQF